VSLVECCFGISKVGTVDLFPLSLPNNNPHVSLFIAVFTFSIARNFCRQSFGNVTISNQHSAESHQGDARDTKEFFSQKVRRTLNTAAREEDRDAESVGITGAVASTAENVGGVVDGWMQLRRR
jgi:hypothetical protein